MDKKLEFNKNLFDLDKAYGDSLFANGAIMITPAIDENYWLFRVAVSENQAIVAFPKFCTLGVGFQNEYESWNTNLPYRCDTEEIYEHIKLNKGNENSTDEDCLEAIRIIQKACVDFNPESKS